MLDRTKLINQATGEFDWLFINQRAVMRADHEFGGPGAPNSYVRTAIRYYQDIAQHERQEWRKAHGLPCDIEYSVAVSYAKPQDGAPQRNHKGPVGPVAERLGKCPVVRLGTAGKGTAGTRAVSYDAWKTRSPDDDLGEPEEFEECPECGGEGGMYVWESVSRWSIDPPSAYLQTCPACGGNPGLIAPATGRSLELYDLEERCGE